MTHSTPAKTQRLNWKRSGQGWQLCLSGKVQAFLERDFASWLCYTCEDTGDDGLLGQLPTLATAKAYLEHHVSFHSPHFDDAPL